MKCDIIIILSFYSTFLIFGLRFGRRDYTSLKIWLERLYPAGNLAGWNKYHFFFSFLFICLLGSRFIFIYIFNILKWDIIIILSFYSTFSIFQF